MIRDMNEDDIPFVFGCLRWLKDESPFMRDQPESETYVARSLLTFIEADKVIKLIYPDRGLMLGHIGPQWFSPRVEAYESLLFVHDQYRGGSTAVKLIKAFEQRARDGGAQRISVGASLGIVDERLERLYERLGYERRGHGLTKRLDNV